MYRNDSSVTNQLSPFPDSLNSGFGTPHSLNVDVSSELEAVSCRGDQLLGMAQQVLTSRLQLELSDLQPKYDDLENKFCQSPSLDATIKQGTGPSRRVPNELSEYLHNHIYTASYKH